MIPEIPLQDRIRALRREIAYMQTHYPVWVKARRITRQQARDKLLTFARILNDYETQDDRFWAQVVPEELE